MSAESRARFAAAVEGGDLGLACLLLGCEVRPDLDVAAGVAALDELAERALLDVNAHAPPFDMAQGMRLALADKEGFRGYGDDYGDLRASLLHEVLRRRRGLPILLSVVYLEVARRLGVPLVGYGLPGHFVVGIPTEPPTLLDPFYGGRHITPSELSSRVSEAIGERFEVTSSALRPWAVSDIVSRVLGNVRATSATPDALRTRLWAVELSLLVPGAPVALHRERGELLARLGDFLAASAELARYAEAVAPLDPAAADDALRASRMARARLS